MTLDQPVLPRPVEGGGVSRLWSSASIPPLAGTDGPSATPLRSACSPSRSSVVTRGSSGGAAADR